MNTAKKLPIFLSLLTIFSGVLIAIFFGVNETYFKNRIKQDLERSPKIQSILNLEERSTEIEKEKKKNWRYYQRFHFHASAIGTMSLVLLIFLNFISLPSSWYYSISYLISLGGFLYPFVWLFAAIYGPIMGRHEAKEAFSFFAYGGGMLLLGVLFLMIGMFKFKIKPNWRLNENL